MGWKKGIFLLLLPLLLSNRAYGYCSYFAETVDSYVIMGQGIGFLYFDLINDSSSTEPITSVSFLFPSSFYNAFYGISIYYPWTCYPEETPSYSIIRCVDPLGLPPGESEIFEVYVSGPNFGAIPSDVSDITDSVDMEVIGSTGSNCDNLASLPSWTRHSIDVGFMLWATPLRVKSGDYILLEMDVANRSTAIQNGIVPSISMNGYVEHISGPSPPSLDLAPNESGRFVWQYKATGDGDIWFSGYAYNPSCSSVIIQSNTVRSGELSTYTYVKSPIELNQETEIWVTVYRYGETSAGMVFPGISISGDISGSLSSPSPVSYPAVPTGGSISFLYRYTPTDGTQGTFTGGATAYSPSTTNAISSYDDLDISEDEFISSSPTTTLPSNNVPITWTVSFLDIVCIFYVAHNPEFTYITGSAEGGWNGITWDAYESPEGVTFVAPSYPFPDLCLPPGEEGHFTLSYTISPVPSETLYLLPASLPEYGFSMLSGLFLLNKKISISKSFSDLLADGNSRGELIVKLTDYLGNPLGGRGLAFFTNRGMLLTHSGVTDSNGEVKTKIVAPFSPSPITGTFLSSYKYDPKNWGLEEGFVVPITIPFNGYDGGNILYVGGTLFPRVCTKGSTLSFKGDFINIGNSPKTLTAPSTFSFTDGIHTYQTEITEAITFNPGERRTISFAYGYVDPDFIDGLYMPSFNYTGAGGDPERTVWDNVLVGGPTSIDIAYFYATVKNNETWFLWGTYSGNIYGFNLIKEINEVREYITDETIPFTGYRDYYYVSGILDRNAYYYLEVISEGGIYLYGPALINEKNDGKFKIIFTYRDDEKNIKGIFSCAQNGNSSLLHFVFLFLLLLFVRERKGLISFIKVSKS